MVLLIIIVMLFFLNRGYNRDLELKSNSGTLKELESLRMVSDNETRIMQTKLSSILFSDNKFDTGSLDYASSIKKNYALLHSFTNRSRSSPSWSNFVDFSISSTAFIQNVFFEKFKSDLSLPVKFEQVGTDNEYTIVHYESLFFPWLKTSIKSLYASFNGRGIVISTGDFHFHHAFLLVKSLRTILKCDLPIEIAYGNNNDLSIEKQRLLSRFKNVKCVDISALVVLKSMQGMNGWWWKSFAGFNDNGYSSMVPSKRSCCF
jgi:hypothetical protein